MAPEVNIVYKGGGVPKDFAFHENRLAAASKFAPMFNEELAEQFLGIFRQLGEAPCNLKLHFSEALLERLGGEDCVRETVEQMQRMPAS